MRKLFVMIAVAAMGCSRESALKEMSEANAEATVETKAAAAARTAAGSSIDGRWRLVETRYNRGNGEHYWQAVPAEQQTVVTFENGKLIANDHYYLSLFYRYSEPQPGTLALEGESRKAQATYVLSGSTLEITYRMREEVVDRFVKQ